MGEDLLPFGDYADIDPHQQLSDDVELVQYQEKQDPDFYQSRDWWWDHQRIRFLKSQSCLSILLMAVPFIWFSILLLLVLIAGINVALYIENECLAAFSSLATLAVGLFSIFLVGPSSTQWIMSGIAWLLKPLRGYVERRFDQLH